MLQHIFNLITFWKPKPKTQVPPFIKSKAEISLFYEKEADFKIIKFAKRHFIDAADLQELFDAELEYEQKKYQARHDFPHQTAIRKSDIAAAKKLKYERIKETMSVDAYRKYRSYRARQKKKYPQKD